MLQSFKFFQKQESISKQRPPITIYHESGCHIISNKKTIPKKKWYGINREKKGVHTLYVANKTILFPLQSPFFTPSQKVKGHMAYLQSGSFMYKLMFNIIFHLYMRCLNLLYLFKISLWFLYGKSFLTLMVPHLMCTIGN